MEQSQTKEDCKMQKPGVTQIGDSWCDAETEERKGDIFVPTGPAQQLHDIAETGVERKGVLQVQAGWRKPPYVQGFGIEDQVADIISVFTTPRPRGNPFDDIQISALLDRSTAPSLPATIYSLAVSNPSFFQTLREAVPPEYCAIAFFKRADVQVSTICRRYSDHLFAGTSSFDICNKNEFGSGVLAEDEEWNVPDARWCEVALKRRVNTIQRHLEIRKPLGKIAKQHAIRVLVRILWEVVDKGGYEQSQIVEPDSPLWHRRNSQERGIGIYGRLIGKTDGSSSRPRPPGVFICGMTSLSPSQCHPSTSHSHMTSSEGFFVVDTLWGLLDCAEPYLAQLTQILCRIKLYGARDGYVEELERFLWEARKPKSDETSIRDDSSRGREQRVGRSRGSSVESLKRPREEDHEEDKIRDSHGSALKRRV